jgi:hypothetical protein
MKRASDFGSALRFAGLAALAGVAASVALEPFVGAWRAHALYALALLPIAGMRFGESLGARARAGFALSLASFALALSHVAWPALALPLAGAFGVARGLCASRGGAARALALEVTLLAAGLAAGSLFHGRGALLFGLSLWAFFLVQAAHSLFAAGTRPAGESQGDPFERARDQALALLDEERR